VDPQPIGLDELVVHVRERRPAGAPLQQLSDAVQTAGRLAELADQLIEHFVDEARRAGASWTEIGRYIGVSKQAAHKRFVPGDSDDLDILAADRLSRFTPRARNAVRQARSEAEDHGDDFVTNEHVILGLLSEPDGLAAKAIVAAGVSSDQLRATTLEALGPGQGSATGRVPFGPSAKKTLQLALREALHLGHNYIGTEHLLLALLRNDAVPAASLLREQGVTRAHVEQQLPQ
jgi:Clp amino terminal domain, pathogenicity island component